MLSHQKQVSCKINFNFFGDLHDLFLLCVSKFFIMKNNTQHFQDLAMIRELMDKSSRFLSLSGLSGIFVGIIALLGAFVAWWYTGFGQIYYDEFYSPVNYASGKNLLLFYVIDAIIVLILALFTGWYFSRKKARKMNIPLWNSASRRLLVNLFIPLLTGGILCILLIFKHHINLVAPFTLIFYGLALVNAGKYTIYNINFLGLAEIVTGILAVWFNQYGYFFWILGFGIWHILYGGYMYFRYERTQINPA